MPKQGLPYINFQPTQAERDKLEAYCKATSRTKTEVMRELIRSLPEVPTEPPIPVESQIKMVETLWRMNKPNER